MANILDYILWRGDLPLTADPWRVADSLCMAGISYNPFPAAAHTAAGATLADLLPEFVASEKGSRENAENRLRLLQAMARSARFCDLRVRDAVDLIVDAPPMQFAAQTYSLPDGDAFVAFRGTDNTLTGWQEDFDMSYQTVPSQTAAAEYLRQVVFRSAMRVTVGGHSKGGNLAVYAAAKLPAELQERITAIYSFDGPGLSDAEFAGEGYRRILHKVHHLVPQSSLIGKLMNYKEDYTVVASSASGGVNPHDLFTWPLNGPELQLLPETNRTSAIMDETAHEWMKASTPEERHAFVDAVFKLLGAANTSTFAEMKSAGMQSTASIISAVRTMQPETRRMVLQLLGRMVTIGTSAAVSSVAGDVLKEMQEIRAREELRSLKQTLSGLRREAEKDAKAEKGKEVKETKEAKGAEAEREADGAEGPAPAPGQPPEAAP